MSPYELFFFILYEKHNPSKNEISNYLNISYSSVNWDLERLILYDMIIEKKDGKSLQYSINTNLIYLGNSKTIKKSL